MVAGAKGGDTGGEARAVEAVHAQPVFRTPVMARAESHSRRVADRWAPEGEGAAQAPAMRSLGFADRVIVSYLGGGERAGAARRGAVERAVAPMDWLFPVPWYLDELDWVSAARAAAWESERAAVRSDQAPAARSRAAEARREVVAARRDAVAATAEARPDIRPDIRFDLPLELVAPSLAAARSSERGGTAAARRSLPAPVWRAYSPMVDPAAARAAEFLAELVERSAQSARIAAAAEPGEMKESPAAFRPAPILEYVAPTEAAEADQEAQRAQVASAARQTLAEARQAQAAAAAQAAATAQAQASRVQAQTAARAEAEAAARAHALTGGAEAARAAELARAASGDATVLEAARAEQAATIEAERAVEAGRQEAALLDSIEGERERARIEGVRGAEERRAATEAARIEAARIEAARSEAARSEAARSEAARSAGEQPAFVPGAPASRRAVELLAMGARGGVDPMTPSAGPRVLMPAGLGGLLAAAQMSRAVYEPESAAAPARRERASGGSRAWSFVASRPAALDHILWSDRWLARFAGASGGALRSFDMARAAPSTRAGAAAEWQPAWVSPAPLRRLSSASAMAVASAAGRVAPERVLTAAVVDDDQPVGDDVFGAIAAAAASDRHRRQRPPKRPRPAGPAEPSGPFRLPAADRALARVAMPRSAGLVSALGASPIAALLANLLDSPAQAPFDARPLSTRSVSDFLARGASPSRAATPLAAAQLARRAPGSLWLSMPSAGPGPWRASGLTSSPFAALPPVRTSASATAALAGRPALSLVAPDGTVAGRSAAPGTASTAAASTAAASTSAASTAAAAAAAAGAATTRSTALTSGPLSWLGAARPGAIGSDAESFARHRSLAVADLSLDFLSPEVMVAARSFGFGPIDAVRAQRLAATGRPEMARLASMVDQVFVAALSPGQTASAEGRAAVGAGRTASGELSHAAPHRAPRGSFLMPPASTHALGLTPGQAEQARPGIGAALDLVAAGQVAEIAALRSAAAGPGSVPTGAAGELPAGTAAFGQPGHEIDSSDPIVRAALATRHREAATLERGATEAARAMLPPHLWSVFDAVYLSLGEETTASDVRPLAPAARAARALALASRARGPEDLPLSARARAVAAWAVLPVVMTGGKASAISSASVSASLSAGARSSAAAASPLEGGAPLVTSVRESRSSASRAGTALASLVAPSFFRGDERGDGYAPIAAERARASVSTTFVQTGTASRPAPAPTPAPAPPPAPRPAPAPAAAAPTQAQFDSWFKDAAKKYFGEAPSPSGLTVAEMTLVTSAPRAQIAASGLAATRSTQHASAAAPAASQHDAPGSGAGPSKPDIDKIAQDVYDQVCRMLDVARERNGDPWSR